MLFKTTALLPYQNIISNPVQYNFQVKRLSSARDSDQILVGLQYTSSMDKHRIVYNLTKGYWFAMEIPRKREEEEPVFQRWIERHCISFQARDNTKRKKNP